MSFAFCISKNHTIPVFSWNKTDFPAAIPTWSLTKPLKSYLPKRKMVFQPSMFKGYLKLRGCTYSRLRKVRRRSMEFERESSDEVSEWPLGERREGWEERNGFSLGKKKFGSNFQYVYNMLQCYKYSLVNLLCRIHSLLDQGFDM